MRQCPKCEKWTLEFDEYFGRFRCFNPDCSWMAISSAELEIRSIRRGKKPQPRITKEIAELGITITFAYDDESDALLVDFGLEEPTFDFPEGDGRMIWKIGRDSGSVAGFNILLFKAFALSAVRIDLEARKETIERVLERMPSARSSGRVSRVLIDSVEVTAGSRKGESRTREPAISDAFTEAVETISATFASPGGQSAEHTPT